MFEWDDILIIGDSFTAHRHDMSTWPMLLSCLLTDMKFNSNLIPRGRGFSGCSWWSARKLFLQECDRKMPKILIMSHTEPQRIPSDDDFKLNSSSVFDIDSDEKSHHPTDIDIPSSKKVPKEVLIAAQQYYKYLISIEHQIWAQEQWFKEIDQFVVANKIEYVLHMHSFLPWHDKKLHEFKVGTTFDTPLWEMSDDKITGFSNRNRNHFSTSKNTQLAKVLHTAIIDYRLGLRELIV